MRIYVAGRWTRKEEVRDVQDALRLQGHAITHDWTAADDPPAHWTDEKKAAYLGDQAGADLRGVLDADAVVILHDDTGRGLFVEFGAALASSRRPLIVVIGAPEHVGACVFYFLGCVERVPDAASAVAYLRALEAA
jgi:hypothetical protein